MRISDWSSDVCSSDLVGCILLVLFAGRSDNHPALAFVRERLSVLIDALRSGAMGTLDVAIACASAGIIIGMLMLTGLGLRISGLLRSEEHTSELQSLMRISYAVFCLKKKMKRNNMKDKR